MFIGETWMILVICNKPSNLIGENGWKFRFCLVYSKLSNLGIPNFDPKIAQKPTEKKGILRVNLEYVTPTTVMICNDGIVMGSWPGAFAFLMWHAALLQLWAWGVHIGALIVGETLVETAHVGHVDEGMNRLGCRGIFIIVLIDIYIYI